MEFGFNPNFSRNPLFHLGMGLLSVPSRSLDPGAVSWGPGLQRGLLSYQNQQQLDQRQQLLQQKAEQARAEAIRKAEIEQKKYLLDLREQEFKEKGSGAFPDKSVTGASLNAVLNSAMTKWDADNPQASKEEREAVRQGMKTRLGAWNLSQPIMHFDPITGPTVIQRPPIPDLLPGARSGPTGGPAPTGGLLQQGSDPLGRDIPLGQVLLGSQDPATSGLLSPQPGTTEPVPGTQLSHRQVEAITGQTVPPGLYVWGQHGPKSLVEQPKPTESQDKALTFSVMMDDAAENLKSIESDPKWTPGYAESLTPGPIGTALVRSDRYKEYLSNAERWSQAAIYLASGAQAPEVEVKRMVRNFFRQPGDTPKQIEEKIKARRAFEKNARARGAAAGRYARSTEPLQKESPANAPNADLEIKWE